MVLEDMRDLLLASDTPDQLFKPIRTLPIVVVLLISDVSCFYCPNLIFYIYIIMICFTGYSSHHIVCPTPVFQLTRLSKTSKLVCYLTLFADYSMGLDSCKSSIFNETSMGSSSFFFMYRLPISS